MLTQIFQNYNSSDKNYTFHVTCFSWNYSTFFNTTQKTGQDFPHVPEVGPPKSVVFIWLTLPVPVNKVGWYNWRGASFSGLCVIVAENNSFCKGSWMAEKLAAVWAPAGCLIVCRLQDNGLKRKQTIWYIPDACVQNQWSDKVLTEL